MTVREALLSATRALSGEDAALEAELLLMKLLSLSKTQLYSRLPDELPPDQLSGLEKLVARRQAGEPVAYILGHREFYGLDFFLNTRFDSKTDSLYLPCK